MAGSNIPFIHKQGDIIVGSQENANHEYLNIIINKNHKHDGYGNGAPLLDPINKGPFITDKIRGNNMTLANLFGSTATGGYLYVSNWAVVTDATGEVFTHNMGMLPKIIQCHIDNAIGTPPRTSYKIAQLEYDNTGGNTFRGRGTFCYHMDLNSIKVGINQFSTNTGDHAFPLTIGSCFARIVCLF